jgi:inosose dehydratase
LLVALGADLMTVTEIVTPESRPAQEAGRVRNPRFSADEWENFAAQVSEIARTLRSQTGLRVAYRHYAGTHVEIAEEAAHLLDRLDPSLVGLCLDTGHWRYAGGDPLKALRHYGGRIWQLYLSDCDPEIRQFAIDEKLTFFEETQAGVFCPLGGGDVDLSGLVKSLRRMDYAGWVVIEQDALSNDPEVQLANARANREFLRTLGI